MCEFGSLRIAYDEGVLRPRSWTQMQSEWAAELSPGLADGPILELCAGAGQIGLLAAVMTGRGLVQVDVDPHAATFACENARAAGVADHEFRVAPLQAALAPEERFSLILADPPYIPSGDVAGFPDDPVVAIDGGEDGLDVVRSCMAVARAHLAPGGVLLLQVRGESQARSVDSADLRVTETRAFDSERAIAKLQPLF